MLQCFCLPALAANIEVKGLFTDAAVLSIDGRERLLKVGQVSAEGVELLEADTTRAILRVGDETLTLHLSEHIGTSFSRPEKVQVHINMSPGRQYLTTGSINSRPVRFLVDTGATSIAINENTARSLGIDLTASRTTRVTTASDVRQARIVNLREVQVGEIKVANVAAIIMDGPQPADVLLGMSFLQHVDIAENAGLMVLTSKL